jgi:hypothetical protein
VRVLGTLADVDHVGEHAFNAIMSCYQVARSGWVGLCQQICPDLRVGGDRNALDDKASSWSGGFCWHRVKANVDGVGEDVRHALREDDVVG